MPAENACAFFTWTSALFTYVSPSYTFAPEIANKVVVLRKADIVRPLRPAITLATVDGVELPLEKALAITPSLPPKSIVPPVTPATVLCDELLLRARMAGFTPSPMESVTPLPSVSGCEAHPNTESEPTAAFSESVVSVRTRTWEDAPPVKSLSANVGRTKPFTASYASGVAA